MTMMTPYGVIGWERVKPIKCPKDYRSLQKDIDANAESITTAT